MLRKNGKFVSKKHFQIEEIKREKEKRDEWKNIVLRIPTEVIKDIDVLIKFKIGLTRTQWIRQAIQKALSSENLNM